MVLGQIDHFNSKQLLEEYNIISVGDFGLSGSFALFRNCEKVNTLFKKNKDWKGVFSEKRNYLFDECGRLNIKKGHKIYSELLAGKSIFDMDTEVEAFTHILKNKGKSIGSKSLF